MSVKVADVMTRKVTAVRGNASFREIAVRLRDERVSAVRHLDGVVAVRDRLDYLSVPPVHIYGPLA